MPDGIGLFSDVVSIEIDGLTYSGWTDVEIERKVNAPAGSFRLGLSEPADLAGSALSMFSAKAQPDQLCKVRVDGILALAARIDDVEEFKSAERHDITVSGRSPTRNAVDSSHVDDVAQYDDLKPSQIGKRVADRLGIEFEARVSREDTIEWFRWPLGVTAHEVIHSAALKQGITVSHTADGKLLMIDQFDRAAPGALVAGVNLLSWRVKRNASLRYSDYYARGQKAPNAELRGKIANTGHAEATDDGLQSYRPKYIVGVGDTTRKELRDRAAHEAARRAGLALQVECEVQGWTVNGQLWEPGTLVYVQIPDASVDERLLISSVSQSKSDDGGTITRLALTRKEAFERGKPSKEKGGGAGRAPTAGAGSAADGATAPAAEIPNAAGTAPNRAIWPSIRSKGGGGI